MSEDNMMTRLVLKDGTILNDCECGYCNGSLWCYLKGLSFNEAFQQFSDPSKLSEITFEYGTETYYRQTIYSGFTNIIAIEKRDFTIDVRLEGYDTAIETRDGLCVSVKEESYI